MRLNHEFTVAAPVDQVWQALQDPERVAPCMPGATLTGVDGDSFTATVQVKLGPVNLKYKGKGSYTERDEQSRTLVIKASGKDVRGAGTASGTSTVTLSEQDGVTHGDVRSELKVTGRPAQFGRGLIAEVGGRLLTEFADNLAAELTPEAPAENPAAPQDGADGPQPSRPAPEPTDPPEQAEPEALNLAQVAAGPVLKRVVPALAVLAVVVAIAARRRKRGD